MNLMFWKKKAASPEEVVSAPRVEEVPDLTPEELEEIAQIKKLRLKKRLLIYGILGGAILLLLGLAFAAWKLLFSARHEASVQSVPVNAPTIVMPPRQGKKNLINLPGVEMPADAAQAVGKPQDSVKPDELEALKKRNEELEAQLRAMKQEAPQALPAKSASVRGASASNGGQVMLNSKSPKENAITLKAAIEAMNAASGDFAKKPPAKDTTKQQAP